MNEHPPIHWIAFDLGGVLVDVHLATLPARLELPKNQVEQAFFGHGRHTNFSTGQLDASSYIDTITADLGPSTQAVQHAWESIISVRPFASPILQDLKRPFTFWSNTDPLHYQKICREINPPDSAQLHAALSYELGCEKPKRLFFEKACSKIQVPPSYILYIDDREENIAAARTLGIQAYRADEPDAIRSVLEMNHVL